MGDQRIGTVIDGRYLLEEVAAEELVGRVYLARETSGGRRVRVKILREEYLLTEDSERYRRFQREVEAFARVRSPGVLALIGSGTHDGLAYAVFPGLPERTLQQLVNQGPIDPRRATELVARVAVGLGALHRDGIIHRDLVATNVLVDEQDGVHVRDLGLASFVSVEDATDSLTDGDHRVGHVTSMAPEYIATRTVHPGADLYALGVIAFQLLTGRPPFPGRAGDVLSLHLHAAPPAPSSLAPGVPPWVDALVAALLSKDPSRRPAPDVVVARVRKGWEPLAASGTPSRRLGRRVPMVAGVGLLVALLAVGGWEVARSGWLAWPAPDPGLTADAEAAAGSERLPEDPMTELWLVPQPLGASRVYQDRQEAAAAGPEVRTGLVEVRANRRVLVTLDGQPLGYAPLKAWVPVGSHALVAVVPARPETRQERTVVAQEAMPQTLTLAF